MEDNTKGEKQSRSSIEAQQSEDQKKSVQRKFSSIPEHLRKLTHEKRSDKIKNKNLQKRKIASTKEFRSNIDVQIISISIESMRVLLQYGFFKMEISVIYTEINQKLLFDDNISRGSFGIVKFGQFQGISYAAKGVKYEWTEDGINLERVYKEFFLCSIADFLQVGPKVFPLFGYDIFLTKTMAFFAMEECRLVQDDEIETLENQLLESLQLMHSVNFVHIDIKPENVAFSKSLKKHVFIDFGLSKMIREPIGQKTKTKFSGTLLYCSPEMRKCYFLPSPMYVDLYENDLCCFKTMVKKYKSMANFSINSQDNFFQKLEDNQNSPFNLVTSVLRFKYFIETQNIQEILRSLERTENLKRTCYEILTSSQIPKMISEHSQIQRKIKLIQKDIFSEILEGKVKCQLYEIFRDAKDIIAEKIIPINQILKSGPEFLNQYLAKFELTLKLFYFFQPFSKNNVYIQNKCELKKAIVTNIYQMKQHLITGPVFFSEKVRFVINYFYQVLRNSKNLQVMIYFRLLFIAVEDWRYFYQLQSDIIQAIDEPFLKVLKILEFYLFSKTLLQDFESKQKTNLFELVQNIPIKEYEQRVFKIKSLFRSIMQNQNLASQPLKFKFTVFKEINLISEQFCHSTEEKQSIYLIKYTFIELCKNQYTVFLQEAPEGLSLEIYSRFFNTLKVKLCKIEREESKLFSSFERQIRSQVALNSSKKQIRSCIQNLLQVSRHQNEFIGAIEKIKYFEFVDKKYVFVYVEKMQQLFINQGLAQFYQVSKKFYYLNCCLRFIHRNQFIAAGQEKIQKQQKTKLLNDLQTSFNKFVESENIKKALKQCRQFKIHVMIIRAKFSFQKGISAKEMEQHILAIMSLFQSSPFKCSPLLLNFLNLFGYLKDQPENLYKKEILVYIGQEYVAGKHFSLFQRLKPILIDFIKIKNQQGKQQQNLNMILSLMENLRNQNYQTQNKILMPSTLLQKVKIFCETSDVKKLMKIYGKIKMDKFEFSCGFYAYLVFQIFLFVKTLINQADQLRQVIRTTLCLGRMAPICQIYTKTKLFQLYKPMSRRKVLACQRILIRKADERRLKIILKKITHEIQNIKCKKSVQVIQRLQSKVLALKNIFC